MKMREFEFKDAEGIDAIFKAQPSLGVPSLHNVVDNAVITNGNDKVIAYGVLKLFCEGVLILDQSVRKRERAEAVKILLKRAIRSANAGGVENLYIISSDDNYTNVLKKRFGFKESIGKLLFLELDQNG